MHDLGNMSKKRGRKRKEVAEGDPAKAGRPLAALVLPVCMTSEIMSEKKGRERKKQPKAALCPYFVGGKGRRRRALRWPDISSLRIAGGRGPAVDMIKVVLFL